MRRKYAGICIGLTILMVSGLLSGCGHHHSKSDISSDMSVEQKYMTAASDILVNEMNLDKYDKKIGEIGLDPVSSEYQSIAQKEGDLGLQYIYFGNAINLNALTSEDIEILSGTDYKKIKKVVNNTIEDVINPDGSLPGDLTFTNDGEMDGGSVEFSPVGTLTLRIAASRPYDENGESVDPASEEDRETKLFDIAEEMENSIRFGSIPVSVQVDTVL